MAMVPVTQAWNKFQVLPTKSKQNYLYLLGGLFVALFLFTSASFISALLLSGVVTAGTAYVRLSRS